MADKKTVVQMYEEILALPNLNDEQKAFIEKRIEITKNKNAKRDGAEPTPKQKEQMAANAEIENAVVAAMAVGEKYTASDLVKMIGRADVATTQKLTPRLSALAESGRVIKAVEKGRTLYTLPSAE